MQQPFKLLPTDTEHVGQLPKHFASVLSAFETYGRYDTVASVVGLPLGTVKSRLHRARARIVALRGKEGIAA
jgi:DNA-directed RNA polymerase specialized sigma24 family protein